MITPNDPTVPPDADGLLSESSWKRSEAALHLAKLGDARGWDYLRSAPHLHFSFSMMRDLAEIRTPAARDLLISFFTDPRFAEMDAGAGETRHYSGIPALAAEALARQGNPRAALVFLIHRFRRWRHTRAVRARERQQERLSAICKATNHDWVCDNSGPYIYNACRRCGLREID